MHKRAGDVGQPDNLKHPGDGEEKRQRADKVQLDHSG